MMSNLYNTIFLMYKIMSFLAWFILQTLLSSSSDEVGKLYDMPGIVLSKSGKNFVEILPQDFY